MSAKAKFVKVSWTFQGPHQAVTCHFLTGLPPAGDEESRHSPVWFCLSLSVLMWLFCLCPFHLSVLKNSAGDAKVGRGVLTSASSNDQPSAVLDRMSGLNRGPVMPEWLPGKVSSPGSDSVVCFCVQQEAFSPPAPTSTKCFALLCPNTKMFPNWCHRWTWWTRPAASPWPMHVSEVKSVFLRDMAE